MKDAHENIHHHYTARELIELIDAAKSRGASFLKVGCIEVVWELETDTPEAATTEPPPAGRRPAHPVRQGVNRVPARPTGQSHCTVCGDQLIRGNWGRPYCVSCYRDKKDRERNR